MNSKDSPEEHFINAYKLEKFDEKYYKKSVEHFINRIKSIGIIPETDVIRNCKIFSIPDFLGIKFDKDPQLFFDATMATGELLCNILLIDESLIKGNTEKDIKLDNDKLEISKLQEAFKSKELQAQCECFKIIIDFALWIRKCELGIKSEKKFELHQEQPKNESETLSNAIKQLTEVILVQRLLVHSRAFKPFVEVIGNIFINSLMVQNKNRKEKFQIVENFIYNEKSSANLSKDNNEYQVYLNFVRTVIMLYNDPQLPLMLRETEIINLATDFGVPAFFHSFVDFLASMIMTPELADYVFNYFKKIVSEILSFKNFFDALFLHPADFHNEENKRQLDENDVLGLESVLRFITAFIRQGKKYLASVREIIEFDKRFENEDFENYLSKTLIKFILLSVPASLKAECFNCLASMQIDLWSTLLQSRILVYDENSTTYEGIIDDIMKIESPNSYFSIPQAFSHLVASMLKNEEYVPVDFIIYHRVLHKIILNNLSKWKFTHEDMKWEMLQNICRAWINLLNRKDFLDLCDPLYRSAISEPDFINGLIELTNDDHCPAECLIEVYRLFLLLAWKENEFLRKALSTSEPLTAGIVNKISRDAYSATKMLKCFMSHFMSLQIVSMELVEFIASASPIIVQVSLTKPSADAIRICEALIKSDEDEAIEDFLIEGSENKTHDEILQLLEKDENGNPIEFNARCFLLQILINLGSSSFFVRYICGFDQHDPPKSIISTNLEKGILIKIVQKLCEEKTHKNYPIFVAKAIQLLLIECRHDLTIKSTLNLLRSSLRPFFTTQLKFLSNPNASKIAIGCFLQIMALENANSVQNGAGLSGIILNSFKSLMTPLHDAKFIKRNVLFLDFIDRIQQDAESIFILNGINDLTVAYLSNSSIVKLMNENKQEWPSTWMQIIFALLEKVKNLKDANLSQKVVGTCSMIANEVLIDKKFGVVNPEDSDLKKLFTSILEVTSLLFDLDHHDSRVSAYSLLNTVANSIKFDEDKKKILQNKEKMILDTTLSDCRSEIPILRSISFSVIEALIPYASPWAFLPFLEQAIATTEDDWTLFDENELAAAFSLSSKCRMYSKFLTTLKSDYSLSSSKVSPSCKIIIDEALIVKLSNKTFWGGLVKKIKNITGNEAQLQTATDILSLFSVISIAFNDSDDLRVQLNWFLRNFPKTLIDFGYKLTQCSLKLYEAFFKLLSTLPNVEDLAQLDILNRIPFMFRYFANEVDWQENLKRNEDLKISQVIVNQLLMHGIFVLMKISEKRDIFDEPLFGEEWRSENNQIQNGTKRLPLSIITSYLGKLLKDINESQTNKIKKDDKADDIKSLNHDNDNNANNDDNDDKLNEKRKGAASTCLLLIWYHINRWKRSQEYSDMGKIKEQAQKFKKEPYISFTGNSSLDSLILKQLNQLTQ